MRTFGAIDLRAQVGSLTFPNPVMCASGTAGHGAELAGYFDLSAVGAVVVKSLSIFPWDGNRAPRLHPADAGMLNSVGLQNPGIAAWIDDDLPALAAAGARVVVSIWGRSVDDYRAAADALGDLDPAVVVAVEVNLSCPNVENRSQVFAHDPERAAEAIAVTGGAGRPRWAKLSPNVTDITVIARAVASAGAEAVTLVNTVMGLAIDPVTGTAVLGNGGGGLSGPAIRPVAVRAVHEVHQACPDLAIVGVGGIARGAHAIEHARAGASAVQVGTATFADPRAPRRVANEIRRHLRRHGPRCWRELVGTYTGTSST